VVIQVFSFGRSRLHLAIDGFGYVLIIIYITRDIYDGQHMPFGIVVDPINDAGWHAVAYAILGPCGEKVLGIRIMQAEELRSITSR
jgi:hypothetical protein